MTKLRTASTLAALLLTGSATHALAQAVDPLVFDAAKFTLVNITVDGQPMQVRRYQMVYVAKPVSIDVTKVASMGGPPGGAPPMGPGTNGQATMGGGPGMGPPPGGMPPGGGAPTSNATAPPNGQGPMAQASDPKAWQTMYVYVPATSTADQAKAIVLQVNNGGWMASPARDILREGAALSATSNTDNTGAALKAGYIVVSAGTRSRGIRDLAGDWAGKAPAVVVDAKAAVRYLRKNDAVMPGSAERIVITGTSGGGGLSVAVSASGNSPDYLPYLAAVGAAGVDASGKSTIRDDVFATIAYCPINDLGHADTAYEWQYSAVRTAENTQAGRWTAANQAASKTLAAQYPAYLEGLKLKREDGSALTAATMPAAITAMVRDAAEAALARGDKLPNLGEDFEIARRGPPGAAPAGVNRIKNGWLALEGGHVKSIDYAAYLTFVAGNQTLKGVPSFDATASTGNQGVSGENTLFGSAKLEYSNFSAYPWDNNDKPGDGSGKDDTGLAFAAYTAGPGAELAKQIKLTSPIPYLTAKGSTVAPNWYVRHGTLDRDTSFAIQATLKSAIQNNPAVKDSNVKLAWGQGHAGNYDVQEAYAWLAGVLQKAGAPR
ncbi:MAG: hypothetical protein J0I28_07340 [Caulobacterales bacterium]|nr:hypothetical protein [Caulobacterales bacterium]